VLAAAPLGHDVLLVEVHEARAVVPARVHLHVLHVGPEGAAGSQVLGVVPQRVLGVEHQVDVLEAVFSLVGNLHSERFPV